MAKSNYDIQELVKETGVPRRNIHFYVQQGLLPPPQGAGLAAFYTEDHLLRLQLIPVMRNQGLRLDEIRERFKGMNVEEMRQTLDTARKAQEAANPKPEAETGPFRGNVPQGFIPPYTPAPGTAPNLPSDIPWSEQRHLHYNLPAGITLTVPENLNPQDRQRLNLLLQAARQIFSGAIPTFVSISSQTPGKTSDLPGNGPASGLNMDPDSGNEPSV